MPQVDFWFDYFRKTVESVAKALRGFPEIDRGLLESIEEEINAVWINPDGTWEEFQAAVGKWKMFFFKTRSAHA
jgi:hypothetical protein